jgi:hypothetical protein
MKLSVLIALFLPYAAIAAEYPVLLTPEEMLAEADDVVHGVVDKTSVERGADGLFYTRVVLSVKRSLDRVGQRYFSFKVPGGAIDGVQLSVPGAPRFSVGEEVVVFTADDGILGFGQGAFIVGTEGTLVQRALPQDARVVSGVTRLLGDHDEASACLSDQSRIALDEDWSLRGTVTSGIAAHRSRGVSMVLIEGLTYRLSLCSDGHSGTLDASVYDPSGTEVTHVAPVGEATVMKFTPEQTGPYTLVVHSDEMKQDMLRSSFGVVVAYR